METETLTIKFDGQWHQVDVQTFVYSVVNFATVVKEANRKNGGQPISINVKATEKGSLLIDLVATTVNNQTLLNGLTMLAGTIAIVGGLYKFHKFISGKKVKETKTEKAQTTIFLDDGSTLTIAENIYNTYISTPAISDSISQNFSALTEDPAVTNFEVIQNGTEKIIEVGKQDFGRMSIKQQIDIENSRVTTESAILHIYKVVFEKTDRKWEFYYNGNRISANILDEDFFDLIDKGESFAKGDQLKSDLQITKIYDESVGTYVNQSYAVIKVHEHVKRIEPQELPFNTQIRG
ncbi:hypothetical protein CO009_00225 [Candidatus Shapirobacteria bacterium CG_4_8_14_3_um_filter_35_11]|uniref:Uncharacterized protein n=1 Tax=Candidatus Shapirobacteria bacterium CG_4_8_14_3_um_filter_35_11 TaxID=1974874 RepID=A0A2M8GL23_9BACT|nr:MAG: hypothetical protein CO009_00225 [Candidatus Shapirobacteria bacterium CG_4_8_14_3_um_filter_35_11]